MTYPDQYAPSFSFTDFQSSNPTTPLPGNSLDNELFTVSQIIGEIITNIQGVVRSDGALANSVVTAASLAPGINLGVSSFTPWAAGHQYALQAGIIINNAVYACIIAHTSGVFATDLAAGKWVLLMDFTQFLLGQVATLVPSISFRNGFINGTGQIAQRGTSFVNVQNAVTQTLDMWSAWKGANTNGMTVSQVAGAATADGVFYRNLVRLQRTAANTDTSLTTMAVLIPSNDMVRYAGKQVTLSFVARAGANFSSFNGGPNPQFATGTGTDEGSAALKAGTWAASSLPFSLTQPLTTALTRYTYTFTVPGTAKEGAFVIGNFPTGTAGAADYYDIGGLQIELGSTATPYEDLPFSDEVRRCLSFYQKSFPYAVAPAQNAGLTGAFYHVSEAASNFSGSIQLAAPLYKSPGITTYNPSAANANWRDTTNSADRTAASAANGPGNILITGSSGVASALNAIHWQAEGGL